MVYNASTGAVIERITSQGYANNRYVSSSVMIYIQNADDVLPVVLGVVDRRGGFTALQIVRSF